MSLPRFLLLLLLIALCLPACKSPSSKTELPNTEKSTIKPQRIRFASYNVALFRKQAGQLGSDLQTGRDSQIQNVAAVIQQVRPDVLALMEFDYDESGQLLRDLQKNYLGVGQHGQEPITYPYALPVASNTGMLSTADFDNDGKIELPQDAYGFGRYEGQYAFAMLSRYPLDSTQIRSFQKLRWTDMPNARKPINLDASSYYSDEAWNIFRLSSKNHIDIPIRTENKQLIHALLAHPTPPVFDGHEDRNGLRNYDEIRLLKDYLSNASYLVDDQGKRGGLPEGASFVVMGDLNADPYDGDSASGAIQQLLEHPAVHPAAASGDMVPRSKGGKTYNRRQGDKGDPAFDTAFFGRRIDYVLPSQDLEVLDSGVFWPAEGEGLYEQVKDKRASDHLLVWVDIGLK
ncbi:MAG: endonuclease/exonuclease/phosphatase family protein [Bacteroidota bacterium]